LRAESDIVIDDAGHNYFFPRNHFPPLPLSISTGVPSSTPHFFDFLETFGPNDGATVDMSGAESSSLTAYSLLPHSLLRHEKSSDSPGSWFFGLSYSLWPVTFGPPFADGILVSFLPQAQAHRKR